MNIEDEKKRFLDLLYASYQASLVKNEGYEFMVGALTVNPSAVYISGNTLEQFGFNYNESEGFFWDILCPSLKADGYLIDYKSFFPMSEQSYLANFTDSSILIEKRDSVAAQLPREYWHIANEVASGRPAIFEGGRRMPDEVSQRMLDEIEQITRRLTEIKDKNVGNISHEFVVNEKKLSKAKPEAQAHVVIHDTPEGASWRSLQIRFTDGRTLLASFSTPPWNRPIGAGELGLEKGGNQRPKEQWLLLEEAARSNGRINFTVESKRRQITSLQQLLRGVFPNLTGSPFETMGGGAYQTVFTIESQVTEDDEE